MNEKFYAVKKGKTPGIYYDWETCKAQVDGFSGAQYKSFKSLIDACRWMGIDDHNGKNNFISDKDKDPNNILLDDKEASISPENEIFNNLSQGEAIAYVDGSFDEKNMRFSYGVVFFYEGEEKHISKSFSHNELSSMRNVAGEIMGSAQAIKTAIELRCKKITVYHDYEGISKWCSGEWKANKEWTKKYKSFYDDSAKKIEINFVKVKSHSKDKFNNLADALAKQALKDICR